HVRRALEALGVAAERSAVIVEDLALAREDSRAAPAVPVVGVLRDDPEGGALAAAADHELGVGRLDGLRVERGVGELVVTPLERGAALLPQRPDHLTSLVQALEPLAHRVEGNAVGLVLVLLPSRALAQEKPSARNDVDLRSHLGDHGRVAVGVAENDRSDPEPRHQGGQGAERAPRLEHDALALLGVRHEVIGHAGDVPPGRFEVFPEVQHARPSLASHAREDAEAHVSISSLGATYYRDRALFRDATLAREVLWPSSASTPVQTASHTSRRSCRSSSPAETSRRAPSSSPAAASSFAASSRRDLTRRTTLQAATPCSRFP